MGCSNVPVSYWPDTDQSVLLNVILLSSCFSPLSLPLYQLVTLHLILGVVVITPFPLVV